MIIKKKIWLDAGERRSRKVDHIMELYISTLALSWLLLRTLWLDCPRAKVPGEVVSISDTWPPSPNVQALTCTTGSLRSSLIPDPLNAALTTGIRPQSAAWAKTWRLRASCRLIVVLAKRLHEGRSYSLKGGFWARNSRNFIAEETGSSDFH